MKVYYLATEYHFY